MGLALALSAALGWGAADYFGGDATRREVPALLVVASAELLGAVLVAPVLIARGVPPPDDPRLLLAALAGVAVTIELTLIYRALARGQAFITAPTGALGTSIAVGVGLAGGDPLSFGIAAGLACALLGGAISAWQPGAAPPRDGTRSWSSLLICAGAALAIATMLTCFRSAGRIDAYWATAIEHCATGASAGVAALIGGGWRQRGRSAAAGRPPLGPLALVALSGVAGDLAYAVASHHGTLSVVVAISSLYPVTTIVLGRALRGHRAGRMQRLGIVLALAGTVILGLETG